MSDIKARREVTKAITVYLTYLKNDYIKWSSKDLYASKEINEHMIKDYIDALIVKSNKEFSRIVVRGSSHSFVVLQDKGTLKRGDILRAKTRTTPDTSFVHGNVLQEKYNTISWACV